MKMQARIATQTGSVYVWSWMTNTLTKVEDDGSRESVLRSDAGPPPIRIGHRLRVDGQRYHPSGEWRPYYILTSPVVSVVHEPDHFYAQEALCV